MQFNFRRVKSSAYLTSVGLLLVGLLFALASVAVAAWIFFLLGIALNVVTVSITKVPDSASRARGAGTRVVVEPEADTEQHAAVPPAGSSPAGSSSLRRDEERVRDAHEGSRH
ncbi:hypothetical protein [Kocuria marina]|uniref:Uncharacterized protein n=1 Tax=Kocuria marina subsp. indica TaxID=1049583 RepID=A0A1X7DZG0_9MICC|nr:MULTISPECIES: hypothetical protein [Kocuria]OXS80910.1 hypothetical protein B1B07_11105 [Kocuria indica]RLP56900.1 hypothetical protein D9R06_11710 [Kocuria indica]SMF24676.1 hypothetical protein SAMN06296028_11819 [Kocuria indica]